MLSDQIGKYLVAGKLQSFYLNGELVDRVNVTYLKFDQWIRIVASMEETILSVDEENIENKTSFGDEEFFYPIYPIEANFPDFEKYIHQRLLGFKELVCKNNEADSFGINLCFESGLNLIIHNRADIDQNEYFFENRLPSDLKEK